MDETKWSNTPQDKALILTKTVASVRDFKGVERTQKPMLILYSLGVLRVTLRLRPSFKRPH